MQKEKLKETQWKIVEQENGEFHVFETVNNQFEDVEPIFEWELSGCFPCKETAFNFADNKFENSHFINVNESIDGLLIISSSEGNF